MTPYSDRLTPGTAIQYRSHGKFNRTWGGVHRPEKGLTISSVPGIGQGHERERPHVDVGFVSKQGPCLVIAVCADQARAVVAGRVGPIRLATTYKCGSSTRVFFLPQRS